MNILSRLFRIMIGCLFGAITGGIIGNVAGELAVDVFDISCFEGGCGYAVLLYILLGILIGTIGGGILFYKRSKSPVGKIELWIYVLFGALLGFAAAWLALTVPVNMLVWFLNTVPLSITTADMIISVYNIFRYVMLLIGVVVGGWLAYRVVVSSTRPPVAS